MDDNFDFIFQKDNGCEVTVKIVPGSSVSKIADYCNEFLRIKISSPPLENRANKELVSFFSDFSGVNKSKIELISGQKSKLKKLMVKEITKEDLVKKICSC